ncbi:MAG: hypothetical protein GC193_05160 [Cryomorphaceae bacterium]|nr:hypothetical protein [Cryomorphaceae bacterium]
MNILFEKIFPTAKVTIEVGPLVRIELISDTVFVMDDARGMSAWILEALNGEPFKVLSLPQAGSSISRDVRDFLASEDRISRVLADAIVANSFHHKLLSDFYLKFNKPKIPTAIFDNEVEARAWLASL